MCGLVEAHSRASTLDSVYPLFWFVADSEATFCNEDDINDG